MSKENYVYLRLVSYVLSAITPLIPAAWAGWITYDATTNAFVIPLEDLGAAIVAGLMMSAAVFKRWGVK